MTHPELENSVRIEDKEFFERELASFVPNRIFDAHCHLLRPGSIWPGNPNIPDNIGYIRYKQLMEGLHPGRKLSGLLIASPVDSQPELANQWIAQQLRLDGHCRGEYVVKPNDDPEFVRQQVRRLGLHGLKCYHAFAVAESTFHADIPEYLPEPLVKVANDEGWVITLHMVKLRGLADPQNLHWIRHYCKTYPNMKIILAHSARGFQPGHLLEGLPKLQGLDNLYFDTSTNCEPMAHQTIIRLMGHEKLMYGTDYPISHLRGRSLAAADMFVFVYEDTPIWKQSYAHIKPVLIGLEHLRSLKWACWAEELSDSAVEDIFWNNAAKLFGI